MDLDLKEPAGKMAPSRHLFVTNRRHRGAFQRKQCTSLGAFGHNLQSPYTLLPRRNTKSSRDRGQFHAYASQSRSFNAHAPIGLLSFDRAERSYTQRKRLGLDNTVTRYLEGGMGGGVQTRHSSLANIVVKAHLTFQCNKLGFTSTSVPILLYRCAQHASSIPTVIEVCKLCLAVKVG